MSPTKIQNVSSIQANKGAHYVAVAQVSLNLNLTVKVYCICTSYFAQFGLGQLLGKQRPILNKCANN